MRLEGKVALITGEEKIMGAAEAKLFAKEGAKVVIADILDEEGEKLEAEVAELGGECFKLFTFFIENIRYDYFCSFLCK
jgi:NAD(P)-dependent dehydrogenase (short-subunit alcohol dehydrogenase family)